MNIVEKDRLVEGLHKIRRKLCVYNQPEGTTIRVCDCKYGADNVNTGHEDGGCPEVSAAIALIEVMTPAEFARLNKRQSRKSRQPLRHSESRKAKGGSQ